MSEIQTKKVGPTIVMSLSFRGPYAQTPKKLDELFSWLMREGHPANGPPFGVFYDDPSKVQEEELRAEVCLPIQEDCEGEGEIERKELSGALVAYAMHQGPYRELGDTYREVFEWVVGNGYRFREELGTREIFHSLFVQQEGQEELLTEVQVPIEEA